ncbi:TFIIS/LEDGF domain superfamily [Arabidopsis suecica]|uniref:TFIIS/LEDGF domain superfamily n=1 Tax=Arabidopsis suecica TaxID=45249 RepID=A0A8T2AI43_ARASU|nr:TFIIS/LEDGF domain superfamily [Arabidopsis suecica]
MVGHGLFNSSWMSTLSSSGRDDAYTCNKALPLNLKKPNVVKASSELKKNEHQRSHDFAAETKKKTEFLVPKKNTDERSKTREETGVKKQSALPMKLSKNPRSGVHATGEIKQTLKKPGLSKSAPATSRPLKLKNHQPVKVSEDPKYCPVLKKNDTETLELFEIAKKSADVANTKGLLAAEVETSVCVDTLSLLMEFPISATATETRRIMVRLENLTKHKNRKICNSAAALLQCWRHSIRDQELREFRKTQG